MKSSIWAVGTLLAAGLGGFGCANDAAPGGPGVKINVAPLTLPGVTNVCYTLEVRNDVGQVVWQQEHVCADQYGDLQSDITYIGTCDATDNDGVNGAKNTVTVTIEDMWDGDSEPTADSEWDNPCSTYADGTQVSPNGDGNGPCQQTVDCVENADMPVTFNLTIMRDANQGFFDVAVNFEDIFCSAKVDCQYPEQGPIQLLFNPNKGNVRDNTIVLGRACTSGVGDATQLHTMPTYITCGVRLATGPGTFAAPYYAGVNFGYNPTSGDGNQDQDNLDVAFANPSWTVSPPIPTALVAWQNANYTGTEQLTQGENDESIGKIYMNEAIGFDFAALAAWWETAQVTLNGQTGLLKDAVPLQGCSLISAFSATDSGGFPSGPGYNSYPVAGSMAMFPDAEQGFSFNDVLTLWTANSGLVCTQNPLDGSGKGGLQTSYITPDVAGAILGLCMTSDGPGNALTGCRF